MIRILLYVFILSACVNGQAKNRKKNPFPDDVHVVLIGFDGWGSHSMSKADMPFLKKMMSLGSWTLQKRSVLPSSSAANWASIFMGASPEIHGYTQWNSKTPEIPSVVIGENNIFPSIFQLLHCQRDDSEIGLFFHWEGIKYVVDTVSIDYVAQLPVNGNLDWSAEMTNSVKEYILERKPSLCTVIYDYPDHFGHSFGFDSKDYLESLRILDRSLEDIVQTTKKAGIFEKTIFVVTSDHGGLGKNHGGKSLQEMETPFLIFGYNIKKDFEIKESMMQYDIAATIAFIFGLDMPQVWIGRPVLSVFENK